MLPLNLSVMHKVLILSLVGSMLKHSKLFLIYYRQLLNCFDYCAKGQVVVSRTPGDIRSQG